MMTNTNPWRRACGAVAAHWVSLTSLQKAVRLALILYFAACVALIVWKPLRPVPAVPGREPPPPPAFPSPPPLKIALPRPANRSAYVGRQCVRGRNRPPVDLTFVMAGRNDEYGGESIMHRMSLTLALMNEYVGKYAARVELLFVEWNAQSDRPPMRDVMPVLGNLSVVRIVTVPPSVHQHWDAIVPNKTHPPIMEFIAKNIGIRRASAPFIMGHAADTILVEEWWHYFASGQFARLNQRHPNTVHRLMRADLRAPIPRNLSHTQMSAWMRDNVARYWGQGLPLVRANETTFPEEFAAYINKLRLMSLVRREHWVQASGDFQLLHRDNWEYVRGFVEFPTYGHWDTVLMRMCRVYGLQEYVHFPPLLMYHQYHRLGGLVARAQQNDTVAETPYWDYYGKTNPNPDDWGARYTVFNETEWHFGQLCVQPD